MKDIGYYAGFLSPEDQSAVTKASLWQLADLMMHISSYLAFLTFESAGELVLDVNWEDQSERDKIALIRGLCDRIEIKLMEAAK